MLKVLKIILFSLLFSASTFAVGIKSSLEVGGDMYKSVYDTNDNGIVDNAESVVDGAISTNKIQNGAITTDKLADNSVNGAKIANGTITNEDISSTANISLTKLSPYPFGTNDIQDGAIITSKIQDNAITGTKIQNGVITENHLSPTAKILKTNEVLTLPTISGNSGKFLKTDGTGLTWDLPSGGSGATTFLQLTDTPSSYSGQAGKVVKVKSDETGLEFGTVSGGGSPGGNNGTVQYNNNGTFAGDNNLTWNPSNSTLNINGALQVYGSGGNLVLANGQIEYINGVNYEWPHSQGIPGSVLTNDGNGNLFWSQNQNSCIPGGTWGSIQYNNGNGGFDGSPYFYFDSFNTSLVIYGSIEAAGGTFTITPFGDLFVKGVYYVLPFSQGQPHSALINDGSGNLTWEAAVGGDAQFKSPIQTITVGSSPFVYQQTYYSLASVIVSGGAVTSIEISRNGSDWYNVGLTQGQFTLNLNDYIKITYTTAPNMYLMEH